MSRKRRNFTAEFLVLALSLRKREMVDSEGNVQAELKEPSLNRQFELLGMSKTAYYYKPVIPFNSDSDKFLIKKNTN